jgi:BMFP domain-containing protein YqiC
VARCTGRHEYAIDLVLREMTARCRELGLRAREPAEALERDLAVLVAARGVEYVYRRREWHAL